jgi:ribonuclease PH
LVLEVKAAASSKGKLWASHLVDPYSQQEQSKTMHPLVLFRSEGLKKQQFHAVNLTINHDAIRSCFLLLGREKKQN